jgi:hypothetical protein
MLSKLPQAKPENIVVQSLENELLVYDLEINKAFCLNETSAIVYQACDGKTDFADFKNKHNFPDEIILLALDSLQKENLLEKSFVSPLKGISRRKVIRLIGKTSLVALPIIASLLAPTSAMAAVSCGGTRAPGPTEFCSATVIMCVNFISPQCQTCSATGISNLGVCAPATEFNCVCL